jgi:hypothetical protein
LFVVFIAVEVVKKKPKKKNKNKKSHLTDAAAHTPEGSGAETDDSKGEKDGKKENHIVEDALKGNREEIHDEDDKDDKEDEEDYRKGTLALHSLTIQ